MVMFEFNDSAIIGLLVFPEEHPCGRTWLLLKISSFFAMIF